MTTKGTEHSSTAFVPRPTTTLQSFLPQFWSHVICQAEQYQSDFKDGQLPLARIKKLVKSDPDIQMIANEVTVLLDKACEIFINEITVRSFLVANSLNRRTVNLSDVALAVSQSDMFDFLIDIVPSERLVPSENNNSSTNLPSTSAPLTSPSTTARSKQRRQPNHQALDQYHDRSPEMTNSLPKPAATDLPPVKKKTKTNKVNRNLLPEEVAVPIPDDELIPAEKSYGYPASLGHALASNKRMMAIPIPDSELIPPRPVEPSWEMAIPITSNTPSNSSKLPPAVQNRAWELAVPISDSTSHSPANWEKAVQITDHDSSQRLSNLSLNPLKKRKRSWELAVPIVDEKIQLNPTGVVKLEEQLNSEHLYPYSSSSTLHHHLDHSSSTMNLNQTRTWQLAVPILDEEPSEGTSMGQGFDQPNQPNYIQSHSNRQVPIDPALFQFSDSTDKIESPAGVIDPEIFHHQPFMPQSIDSNDLLQNHNSIKQEEE